MTIQERVAQAMANQGVIVKDIDGKNMTFAGMGNDVEFTTEVDNDAFGADDYVTETVAKIVAGMSGK